MKKKLGFISWGDAGAKMRIDSATTKATDELCLLAVRDWQAQNSVRGWIQTHASSEQFRSIKKKLQPKMGQSVATVTFSFTQIGFLIAACDMLHCAQSLIVQEYILSPIYSRIA